MSAFGATERPATAGLDPAALAQTMADFVRDTDLDGLDADWEELEMMVQQPGVGERWLVTFTQVLRTRMPQGQFIISHARESSSCAVHSDGVRLTGVLACSCGPVVRADLLSRWGLP